jgi:hypothetical protein
VAAAMVRAKAMQNDLAGMDNSATKRKQRLESRRFLSPYTVTMLWWESGNER